METKASATVYETCQGGRRDQIRLNPFHRPKEEIWEDRLIRGSRLARRRPPTTSTQKLGDLKAMTSTCDSTK
jgi:hypothetical protein